MKLVLFCFVILAVVSTSIYSQELTISSREMASLCGRINQIKELPHDRSEKGIDKTYDRLREAGTAVVPCLINNITKIEIMKDPRCPGISNATAVGDVSYFVLVDILDHLIEDFLPSDVQNAFKTNGVYAYHEYIDRPGARGELKKRLRVWYAEHREKRSSNGSIRSTFQ